MKCQPRACFIDVSGYNDGMLLPNVQKFVNAWNRVQLANNTGHPICFLCRMDGEKGPGLQYQDMRFADPDDPFDAEYGPTPKQLEVVWMWKHQGFEANCDIAENVRKADVIACNFIKEMEL